LGLQHHPDISRYSQQVIQFSVLENPLLIDSLADPAFESYQSPSINRAISMALNPRFAGQKLVASAHPQTLHTLELCMASVSTVLVL
jgi:hypothetical protein